MCKRDEDIDLWSGNVQIQPWKLEPLESGKDSVIEAQKESEQTIWPSTNQYTTLCET